MKRIALLVCVMVMATACCGCSWLRGACATALPVISVGHSYSQDAQVAIDQAEAKIATFPLTQAQKDQAAYVIEKCRVAVRTAEHLLSAASSACSEADPFVVFADLLKAWKELEPLLVKPGSLGAAPGEMSVYAPAIVIEAKARGVNP